MQLKGKNVAIVGASNNPEKYGNKVTRFLTKIAGKLYPINPKETQIVGLPAFPSLSAIKEPLDIVVFVVPPQVSLQVVQENLHPQWHYWFQPGSFDETVIAFCKEQHVSFTSDACVMIEGEKELRHA